MTVPRGFAVVGYAVRFPGAADSGEFWRVLADGRDAVSVVPPDRWDVDEFFDPDPNAIGKSTTRRAGFVDDVAGFDAPFFGVSAREAMFMDPQHRLMLETAWSAVEHAGIAPSSLNGTSTGVFMGLSTHEFLGMLIRYTGYEDVDIYSGTGTSPAAGAGRISFRLGLQGPAVVVDTACSSSLVAVHQACQALASEDCDLALVGGVNVILTPVPMINLSRAGMLAPDGRCKTFAAAADGYVRGEGCGVVVLKRTADAIRDGDRVRAVIRASAVNQDGASGGLTVPNGGAQQRVIAEALRRAGITGADVDYLEAHGTGTSLGDPIEVQAAGAVLGEGRDADRPLLIGSVKTNIGHLEAASGVAGLIKVVLSLEHETLPEHLHFQQPSPHIPWDRLPVRVVDKAVPWPRTDRPRLAGVSSFGFSGTNAHLVVEEAPEAGASTGVAAEPEAVGGYQMLPLSARSPEALAHLTSRYLDWLDAHPEADLADICAAAGAGRSHFEHRAALVVDSRRRARRLLRAMQEERPAPGLVRGVCADRPKTAWLFPGQGSQFPAMARALLDTEPVFRATVTRCAEVMDGLLPRSLVDVLTDTGPGVEDVLRDTTFAQPALFAVEMGLARLWQSWGIEPDVVLGHSVGQYAAACVAGVFDLDDGARLIAQRGRLFGQLPTGGRMVAVFGGADRAELCAVEQPRLSVAAYNGASTVLSGPVDDLERAVAALTAGGIRCDWLDTSHAFHSALLDPVLDEFELYAEGFDYESPQLTLICNRTGKVLPRRTHLDASYWRRHAREPVQFADSVHTMSELGCGVLMEIGPQPVLTTAALRAWPDTTHTPPAIASLRRDADAGRCFTEALATAYTVGHRLDFAARRTRPYRSLDLPTYPFQHRSYWFPVGTAPAPSAAPRTPEPAPATARIEDWLGSVPPQQRINRITELILTELGEALRMPVAEIDPQADFVALGLDSMVAMELRGRLQAALDIAVPASLFFTHPGVSALAKGLLELWLETAADPAKRQSPIARVDRGAVLPISHAQEQLWFLNQLLPSSSAYNVAARVDIPGPVNPDVLRRSLEAVVNRHEVLRTTFRSEQGAPQVVPAPARPFELPFVQLAVEPDEDAAVTQAAEREAAAPFDIGTGPLLRARLFGLSGQRHVLVLTMHHIVTDGWSFRVLLRELGQIYQAFASGDEVPLADLPIQYADYAQWQRDRLHGPDFEGLLEHWRQELAGAPPLELDTDRPRPKTPMFRGARIRFDLGRERAMALRDLCRTESVTLSVPLLAAFAAVLQRHSGQDDIVVGTLTANRAQLETEDLIGLFVNALPVRIRLDGNPDVAELLDRTRRRMVDVLAHQDVPFDMIVNATAPDRAANRNPLFGVQLVVQPATAGGELSGLGLEVSEVDTYTAKRDLTLTFFDDALLTAHAEYDSELFDADRIERMIAHFTRVVDAMVADRGQRVADLPLLTESEQAQYRINRSPHITTAPSIAALFETVVDRSPDAIAVTTAGRSLTYRQLDRAANWLAGRLSGQGVLPGMAVGLCVGRTSAMAVGMLGILKAGAIYVPIDPSYPEDRIEHIVADAGVVLRLDEAMVEDLSIGSIGQHDPERLETPTTPDEIAYIMYTSGSTGRPKGVAVSHGGVVEYAETLGRQLGITADDVYLETASISFSSSIRQLLVPFAVGAQVVIASLEERRDPVALLHRIADSEVTVADLVPTVVQRIVDAVADRPDGERAALTANRLRLMVTASEPLRAGVVRAWRERMGPGAAWINMYGQTETTGIVSLHRIGDVDAGDQRIMPIGRPRDNIGMYVLDPQLRLVPPGVTGELYICGPALAREYWGAPELTARKFIPAPWDDRERLYASGDVVRLGWDGTIEFRSRADRQVKIRGLRVEPAEIDRVLLDHPGIREAVSLVREINGSGVLVAYFVADEPVPAAEVRAHVRRKLPEHMVPAAFLALDRLPQTSNGKLDQAALPEVTIARDQDVEYVAPRAGVEESLASIWRDTLQIEQIGAADNFFALGGHSLLAAQVRSRIHQLLGIELPLDALFEDQTLADLARRIEGATSAEATDTPPLRSAPRTGTLPASYAQELMWQLERDDPGSPAHWIDLSIRIRGPLDSTLLVAGVQQAVARHELLRTTFRPTATSVTQVILPSHLPDVPMLEALQRRDDSDREWRDLDVRPPFRPELVRVADGHHILRLRVHRILADGYTMRLLLSEIGGLVASSVGFDDFPLLDGDLQYADYAAWERSWLTGDVLARHVEHFRREFASRELPPALPTDHPRTGRAARRGGQYTFEFPSAAADAARALAVREQASLYAVLLAAFAAALGRYADRGCVVIGSPVTRRNDPATQLMLGPMMNTVPLCVDVETGDDLPRLVGNVKATVLQALAHQDAPWQHVLSALADNHGPSAQGIGETVFLMDDPAPGEFAAGGFTLTRVAPERIIARRELTVAMSTRSGQISGTVTYDDALYEASSIEGIITNFIAALTPSSRGHRGERSDGNDFRGERSDGNDFRGERSDGTRFGKHRRIT